MTRIEDYLCGEDLAQLLEDLEYVFYHGWGSVELEWRDHQLVRISRTSTHTAKRTREHTWRESGDPIGNQKEK